MVLGTFFSEEAPPLSKKQPMDSPVASAQVGYVLVFVVLVLHHVGADGLSRMWAQTGGF